jgi:hypothetical protein
MRRLRWLCLVVAPLLLGGCSTNRGPTGPLVYPTTIEASDGVPPPTPLVLQLQLPLDTYLLSIDEIYTVEAGTDILVQRCMTRQGLSWPSIDRPTFGDWRNRRRYGVIEPAVAQRFGYHAVPALLSPVQVYNEKVERYRSLSRRQLVAALDPKTGCEKQSILQLREGIDGGDDSLAGNLGSQSLADSEKQPDVRLALAQWSNCMQAAGYRYPDPLTASADPQWSKTKIASRQEIATAEADVRCKSKTALVTIWYHAEVRLQQDIIQQHRAYLDKLASYKTRLLGRATSLVHSGHA